MQVLVALAQAQGSIITRDDLVALCWDGRVVGDDAINRVMSRLRRVAEGIGAGSFAVETVTKVGYRLACGGNVRGLGEPDAMVVVESGARTYQMRRRAMLFGATAASIIAVGGATFAYRRMKQSTISPEVRNLMTQAEITREQVSLDSANETLAIYQRVLTIAPDYADAWGKMGFTYAIYSHFRERDISASMRSRAEAAGRRALELDPRNVYGELALAVALPFIGHWLEKDRRLRRALANQPDNAEILFALGYLMMLVGRAREATGYYERIKVRPLRPVAYADYILALGNSGRYEDMDRAMADAALLYPTHPMVWGNRFEAMLFNGRPSAARAMVQDVRGRPQHLSDRDAATLGDLATALDARRGPKAQRALETQLLAARQNLHAAGRAIKLASALGRVDEAFELANAYYFSRGYRIAGDTRENERDTIILFAPVTKPMRGDPRFDSLVDDIGLERFWRQSGTQPDYRAATPQ